jgi:hypothetical protein
MCACYDFVAVYLSIAIVLVIRLIVPLSIFRWPLWGGVAALVADMLDIVIITLLPFGEVNNYHRLDKFPDMYYLAIEMIVGWQRWDALPKRIGLALFVWRLAGFVLFEITGTRKLLFFFPNLFESFFIFMSIVTTYGRWYTLTPRRLAAWLLLLGIARQIQEYFLHWRQALDNVVAVDVIRDISDAILGWIGDSYVPVLAALLPCVAAMVWLALTRRLGWVPRWTGTGLRTLRAALERW